MSLFSRAGGFTEGARLAGLRTVAAVEIDRFAAETFRQNFPDVPVFADDIASFLRDGDELWRTESSRFPMLGKVGVVYGGPPCQGYSQIGKRLLDDPRNGLYEEFVRVVSRVRTPIFLMENVRADSLTSGGRAGQELG